MQKRESCPPKKRVSIPSLATEAGTWLGPESAKMFALDHLTGLLENWVPHSCYPLVMTNIAMGNGMDMAHRNRWFTYYKW